MFFKCWILFNIAFIGISGQKEYDATSFKLFYKQIKKYLEIEPDLNDSCLVSHPSSQLYLRCPTRVNCYLKSSLINISRELSVCDFNGKIESLLKMGNSRQLEANKIKQLNAVLDILQLTNETVCEFSSIETLDSRDSNMNNMGQVGRANCSVDNVEVSQCPYKLKYLFLQSLEIENLSNNSFCQFPRLEFLGLVNCGIKSIEADAFVHLIHLKEMTLRRNGLTHLPAYLFKNNVHLETVDVRENQLQIYSLNPILSINSLKYLLLSSNNITSVDDILSFPLNLERLYFDNNKLKNLRLDFKNLKNLTHLVMSNNSISKIDENAFFDMGEVKLINLENNTLHNLPPNTFKNTLKLEQLRLRHNKLIDFPPIAHLRNLIEIDFAWNKISYVNKSHLLNCIQLSNVDLSTNELSLIENGSFDALRQLRHLDLSGNRLTQLTANFKNSIIIEINLNFNRFTSFSYKIFPSCLTKLSMAGNQINTIEPFYFTDQNEWVLTHITLWGNKIESIENLQLPNSIQSIDLRGNLIRDVLTLTVILTKQLDKLQSIDLSKNRISILCKPVFYSGKISLFISGNPLNCSCENVWIKHSPLSDTYTFADLKSTGCKQKQPYKKIKTFINIIQSKDQDFLCQSDHVTSNRCQCPSAVNNINNCELPCPTNCTCLSDYPKSIIYFMCKRKNFKTIPSYLSLYNVNYVNAKTALIDLSHNSISHIDIIDFGNLTTKFTRLHLYNSSIKFIQHKAFDKLVNLENLILANNQLEALPDQIFYKLTRLIQLDLSSNRLTQLADDMFRFQINLKKLLLSSNNLSYIHLDQLTQMQNLSNITLDDNPWSCECAFTIPFRNFLVNPSTVVNNKLQINCSENGEEFNISSFNLEKCLNQLNKTVLIVSLTFGILLAITAGLVFKWRYELQVLVYARYGFRILHRKQTDEEVESKQYDAFVAYNSADTDFLIKDLMPGLEKIDNPYRLCIHERDFPAGSYIQDSILDAISMSSRTIVLLSENFVSSGWCRFEFKSAHMQMLQDRCPRILVIVLGEVPGTLDPEMKLYLKTNTYLKWGEKLFWQKLYYAMPDKRVTTPATDIMPMRNL